MEEGGDEQAIMIDEILDRDNYVARQSPHNKRQQHIIASNLDQSILLATLKSPKTSQGFIDRFLIACESFHIPAIIVFNKADLYEEKEMASYEEMKEMYEAIGYKVILISLEEQKGLEQLEDLLKNKTTLISGHSGVGKSSLINYLFPELDIITRSIVTGKLFVSAIANLLKSFAVVRLLGSGQPLEFVKLV